MKLRKLLEETKPETKMGRKKVFGGSRLNFFPGEDLLRRMRAIEEERQRLRLPHAFTKSWLGRFGLMKALDFLEAEIAKAKNGDLHAKRRVRTYGEQLKKEQT